jgi:hypothetical protein
MPQSITDELLGVLQGNPHKSFSAQDLADLTGWTQKQCAGALVRLTNMYSDVVRPAKGLYWYHPERQPNPLRDQMSEEDLAAIRSTAIAGRELREANRLLVEEPAVEVEGNGGALKLLRAVARAPLPDVIEAEEPDRIPVLANQYVPTFFEAMTTDENDHPVLRDDRGRWWVAIPLKPAL